MSSVQHTHQAAKTLRVATTLDAFLGKPRQATRLPAPLDMLIATILSQNTNDKNSHRAYTNLRRRFPRWEDVANAPLRSLIAAIKVGGMAKQKSVRIQQTLRTIKNQYGRFDLSMLKRQSDDAIIDELTRLNGVGKKTAACVLLFSLGRDVFPVDTHVHRICNRLGLVATPTPEKTFDAMKHLVPKGRGYSFHTNLIRFGRKICRSANPACDICPLYDECVFEGKRRLTTAVRRPRSNADHDFMLLDNVHVQP